MKVSELIAALANFPPDANVICQSDAEGNGYSPLAGVDEGDYVAESTWSGYIVDPEDEEYEDKPYDCHNDEGDTGIEEDDEEHDLHDSREPTERVVILFPVN